MNAKHKNNLANEKAGKERKIIMKSTGTQRTETLANSSELLGAKSPNCTVFGGTLTRKQDNWYWPDGTKEPKVSDFTVADRFNFRMASEDAIEVPEFKAESHPELAWVKDGGYETVESRDGSANQEFLVRFPERRLQPILAYLVPRRDWDKHTSAIVGVSYAEQDVPILAGKARSFGWEWATTPARAESPAPPADGETEPFSRSELMLVADVLNGINSVLVMDEHAWGCYTGSDDPAVVNNRLAWEVGDAMAADRLDQKWGVEFNGLCRKLTALHPMGRRLLILGVAEFWNRAEDAKADEVFDRLLRELNGTC
jgi:hypothetical protein